MFIRLWAITAIATEVGDSLWRGTGESTFNCGDGAVITPECHCPQDESKSEHR
jgi:hypothetical protein